MPPAYLGEVALTLAQNQWWLGVFERSEAGRFSQQEWLIEQISEMIINMKKEMLKMIL